LGLAHSSVYVEISSSIVEVSSTTTVLANISSDDASESAADQDQIIASFASALGIDVAQIQVVGTMPPVLPPSMPLPLASPSPEPSPPPPPSPASPRPSPATDVVSVPDSGEQPLVTSSTGSSGLQIAVLLAVVAAFVAVAALGVSTLWLRWRRLKERNMERRVTKTVGVTRTQEMPQDARARLAESVTLTSSSSSAHTPSLRELMTFCRSQAYAQAFEDAGWDDVHYLCSLDQAALTGIATSCGMKPGHIAKFLSHLDAFRAMHALDTQPSQSILNLEALSTPTGNKARLPPTSFNDDGSAAASLTTAFDAVADAPDAGAGASVAAPSSQPRASRTTEERHECADARMQDCLAQAAQLRAEAVFENQVLRT